MLTRRKLVLGAALAVLVPAAPALAAPDPLLADILYGVSDALIRGSTAEAARILSELNQLRVAPHKIMFWVARDLRWLASARLCVDCGRGTDALVELCAIRYRFQAENMMRAARKRTMDWCQNALLCCCETAYRLNTSGGDGETLLEDLLIRLSV